MSGERISVEEFYTRFEVLEAATQTSFVKLERLQQYDETGASYHDAFARGDLERAVQLFWDQFEQVNDPEELFCKKGISSTRIRLVELPLSDYLKWEFQTYKISALYGDRILVRDITEEPKCGKIWTSSDFLMFDDKDVLRHDYDPQGRLVGAIHITAPEVVRDYVHFSNQLRASAVSLGRFVREHNL